MELMGRVRAVAEEAGASYAGVADLALAREEVLRQGGDLLAPYTRCISLGIALTRDIVDRLPQRRERAVAVSYDHLYRVTNQRLDHLAARVSGLVERAGFRAWPVPASERVSDERICAVFSHKLGAHLAGLGWIGRSCLLITPDRGPRVRFVSVLTDAPLEPTGGPLSPGCGECRACVEACPVGAFTGRPFAPEEPREARYDARRCHDYFRSMSGKPVPAVCGLCVQACPYGQAG